MTGEIIKRLPPDLIRRLARRKGRKAVDESTEELTRWLLERYISDISRAVGKQSLLERARNSVRKLRKALDLPEPDEEEEESRVPIVAEVDRKIPDTVPNDPALRTATLAEVYERQGMVPESLAIYRELATTRPDDASLQEAIDRLTGEEVPEGPEGCGPAVGGDAYAPARKDWSAGPVDLPDMDDLPLRYGVDEAVLMMVTPDLMYAFWEVTPETEGRVRQAAGDGRLILRIWKILVEEGRVGEEVARDLDVPSTVGEYFIHDMNADGLYRAGVGLFVDDRFHPMVLTSAAGTPSTGPSGRVDEEWMEVDQQVLAVRSKRLMPLNVKKRTRLTAREMALLRLHAIGPDAYSGMTGIDEALLEEILSESPRRVEGSARHTGSSDTFPRTV